MDTESTLAELDRLIADVEDKAFDCGAWEHGSAEDRYDIMLDRLRVAKDKLRRFVTTSQNTQGLVTPGTGLSPEKGAASRRHQ